MMQVVDDARFVAWLAERGVIPDPTWQGGLTFEGPTPDRRRWIPKERICDFTNWIGSFLRAASESGPFWLYRRGGGSWFEEDSPSGSTVALEMVLMGARLERSVQGAVGFTSDDLTSLLVVLAAFAVFGWSYSDDLFIIPEDRTCLLMLSHHGEVEGQFQDLGRQERFDQELKTNGFGAPAC